MNYYERHIGDYLKDTAHLSLLEHGVYTRLLDVYYTREGGIPDKEAARLIGARSRDEREALQAVLAEFFDNVEGVHIQRRCDLEIDRYKGKQEKARRSAEARWGASKKQSEGNANASYDEDDQAMRTHCEGNAPRARPQTPDTSLQTPDIKTHTATATDGGRVCRLLRKAGISDGNPGHPDLLALIAAGASDVEFDSAARTAVEKGKGFAYAIGVLKGQRRDAADAASTMHRGPMPAAAPAGETAYQRSMRERIESFAPDIAAKAPGQAATPITIENGAPGAAELLP